MSQCGVNIPLSDLAEAIIDNFADVFAAEIIKRLNLSRFVEKQNGVANDLTLRGSLTIDDGVKASLCSSLQDCIANKIQDELGCERDNHVTKFFIDKQNDRINLSLKFGEEFYISRTEIEDWLKIAAGGIKAGVLTIGNGKQIIKVTNNDNTTIDIDVSALKDTVVESGKLVDNTTIRIKNSDDTTVDIDVSALRDIKIERGEIVDNTIIRLHRSDGVSIDINAASLVPENSPYIVSGVFIKRDGGYWLDFTRNDDTKVNVDMTAIIGSISQAVFDRVMEQGYRLNTQSEDYTTIGDDFDGRTIIRADKNGDQDLTITKPLNEDFIGKSITVRKTNGEPGTFLNLVAGDGVTLLPADITPLRRVGSSVTLIYVGNGVYDAVGELP